MLKHTTAERLKEIMDIKGLRQVDIVNLAEPFCKKYGVRMGRSAVSQYISGTVVPRQSAIYILGQALNVSEAWLMGFDVPMEKNSPKETECVQLSPDAEKLLADYNKLNTAGKEKASEYVADLTTISKYTETES